MMNLCRLICMFLHILEAFINCAPWEIWTQRLAGKRIGCEGKQTDLTADGAK